MKRSAIGEPHPPPEPNPNEPDDDEAIRKLFAKTSTSAVPTMGRSYKRVIERILKIEVWAEYAVLEGALRLDKPFGQANYTTIAKAMNDIDDHAFRAAALAADATIAYEAFEVDLEIMMASFRAKAREALEAAKAAGKFTGAIHGPDIDAYLATHFSKEVKELRVRQAKAKQTVKMMEALTTRLHNRGSKLQTLAERARA